MPTVWLSPRKLLKTSIALRKNFLQVNSNGLAGHLISCTFWSPKKILCSLPRTCDLCLDGLAGRVALGAALLLLLLLLQLLDDVGERRLLLQLAARLHRRLFRLEQTLKSKRKFAVASPSLQQRPETTKFLIDKLFGLRCSHLEFLPASLHLVVVSDTFLALTYCV